MSLLSDTIFTGGSTRLHVRGGHNGPKVIRKSKSYGGFLPPLAQLVRNPIGTLGGAVGDYKVPEPDGGAANANRRQILYLRMKDVGTSHWWWSVTC
jgi:TAG lipase/steryl ester hydrolase/phospholipase A2/LPA acyltransferase